MASLPSGISTEEEARRHSAYARGYYHYKGVAEQNYPKGGNPFRGGIESTLWTAGACCALDEDRGHESNAWHEDHFGPPLTGEKAFLQLTLFE